MRARRAGPFRRRFQNSGLRNAMAASVKTHRPSPARRQLRSFMTEILCPAHPLVKVFAVGLPSIYLQETPGALFAPSCGDSVAAVGNIASEVRDETLQR